MNRLQLFFAATLVSCWSNLSFAAPVSVEAVVTADNHYALYYGNETKGVTYVGMNEIGWAGSHGGYNWSMAETWNFDISEGDYIYVAGWSDGNVAQAAIGQFTIGGETLLTDTSNWLYMSGNQDLNDGDPAPTEALVNSLISGTWGSVDHSLDHGVRPWGIIDGISYDADWIWGTPNLNQSGSNDGEFQIFRTKYSPVKVSEPSAFALFGLGLLSLAWTRKRTKSGKTSN